MKNRKIDWLGWVILATILISSYFVHTKLSDIRHRLEQINTPKTEIRDVEQFSQLCDQLSKQWQAKGYAFYLMQPKSPVKTYKEKVTSSKNLTYLPLRVDISKHWYTNNLYEHKYFVGNNSDAKDILTIDTLSWSNFAIIPVYQHNVIIGELYVMYDKPLDSKFITSKVYEAQVLSKLIQ